MPVTLRNNAVSRLASSLTSGATTLSVTAGEGEKFPTVAAGQWFPLTIVKTTGVLEIVKAIGRTGDVINIVRAQEGTAAQAFVAGDRVELRLTVSAFDDIIAQINALRSDALLDANNLADLTDKAIARQSLQLGTAAQGNFTLSTTDTNAGRVLKVGDAGILGPSVVDNVNANNSRPSGLYAMSSAPNAPFSALNMLSSDWGVDARWQSQLALGISQNRAFFRSIMKDQSSATSWAELWHNGNLSAAELAAILGFKPVQQGTGSGQTPGVDVKIGWDAISSLRAQVNSTDLGNLWTEAVFRRPDAGFVHISLNSTLPAGGTWAYSYITFNGGGGAIGGASGIAAGGTAFSGNNIGFAWRFI